MFRYMVTKHEVEAMDFRGWCAISGEIPFHVLYLQGVNFNMPLDREYDVCRREWSITQRLVWRQFDYLRKELK